jgi:hypothetical protein
VLQRLKTIAGACLLTPALFAGARVEVQTTGERSCGSVVIMATPVCAAGECGSAIRWNAGEEADLSSAEEWSVTASSKGCWSPALYVRRDAKNVVLPLWPEATLTGRLVVPKSADMPASVGVQIESSSVPRSRFDCPVSKNTFRCAVPATALDIRVSATGFVPRYFWQVNRPNLGEIAFTRGGSIAGTIRFEGDGPPVTEVALELKPATPPLMNEGWSAEEQRLAPRATTLRPNDRGFFQFPHLAPGQYTLTARREGWSRARRADLEVREGEETALAQPLILEPLAEVDVLIQPPLDPYGKPWQVSLREMVPLSTMSTPIVETDASMSGMWSAAGIDSGFHRIDVLDHRGSSFAYSVVEVSPRMAPVTIAMSSVAIRGTVHIADEPLRAHLQFRNGKGTVITMRSDAEGRFSGALPEDGAWDILIPDGRRNMRRTVDVRAHDGVADVDIRLPDTRLAGKVVSSSGAPVTAFVRLWSEERKFLGSTSTDENGEFRLTGIEPGAVYLEAESRASASAKSGFIPLIISETPAEDLTVVLRQAARLNGRLRTPAGVPVAGAIVRYLLPDRPGHQREEVSGPGGTFAISVSPGTAALDLVILPPALPAKIARVPMGEQDIVVGGPAGMLEIEMEHRPPFAWITHDGVTHSLASLRYPANWTGLPRGVRPWGMALEIEAGEYTICGDAKDRCVRKVLAPGAVERVNGRSLLE